MVLDTTLIYPSDRAYVLKLHRDAMPANGKVFGRLENLSSGEQFQFASHEELLACLVRDLSGQSTSQDGAEA
jgi:sortase (surface protein transpeptidase)